MELDVIIYNALTADELLAKVVGNRIKSTCFEVSPTETDNVELPYIIVTDDGFQNQDATKDNIWESAEDTVQSSVEISGRSPREVKNLVAMVRQIISNHISGIAAMGEEIPELDSLTSDGLAWDWTKPCYFQTLTYRCTIQNEKEDE